MVSRECGNDSKGGGRERRRVKWCTYPLPADGSYCEHGREIFDEEVAEEEGGKGKERAAVKKPVS